MSPSSEPYPSDVSGEKWAVVALDLTLMPPEAPQHRHDPHEVDNVLRWTVRIGSP